ncbi:MAG: DUF4910 domain-containing protein [Deltaproteobacteria bacterium]|nr:DUF4910 domain-containing protein [Deltaproteobacteria bacterium]
MAKLPLPGSRSKFQYPFPSNFGVSKARMFEVVAKHWRLNRTAVNQDTDILVAYLTKLMNANVLEAPSGQECLTWKIPKHWKVNRGKLCRLDGTVIADYADNPLVLWTHSIPFHGEIDRSHLVEHHVQTDPNRPFETLYHYRNGYRYDAEEWGFSLPYAIVEGLTDEKYFVDIDSQLDNAGSLKIVDAYLPGESAETIFIMAHTCHPALVSDGIACIAAAVELYELLRQMPSRKYSYRFLFGPEYFAACAYLTLGNQEDLNNLRYGIYLDMLSNHEPLGFQESMQGNSRLDQITRNVLRSHIAFPIERPYRKLWGNDETFYNGAGYLIPTIGVGRGEFREYHYDTDNLENMSSYHMVESVWALYRITQVFETDFVPVRLYSGPLYLSRFGLYVDPAVYPDGAVMLERIQAMIDGERSCMDIAAALDADYFFVSTFCERAVSLGLMTKKARPSLEVDFGTMS